MTTQTDAATVVKTSEDAPHGSVTVTEGVRVEVRPEILASHTDPDERRWVFVYRVKVTNGSDRPVRIVARQWTIIDSHGDRETVEGEGVVGEQPALEPGGSFSYESFCPLGTPWGRRWVSAPGRCGPVGLCGFATKSTRVSGRTASIMASTSMA